MNHTYRQLGDDRLIGCMCSRTYQAHSTVSSAAYDDFADKDEDCTLHVQEKQALRGYSCLLAFAYMRWLADVSAYSHRC
jgi:hypothetical protein